MTYRSEETTKKLLAPLAAPHLMGSLGVDQEHDPLLYSFHQPPALPSVDLLVVGQEVHVAVVADWASKVAFLPKDHALHVLPGEAILAREVVFEALGGGLAAIADELLCEVLHLGELSRRGSGSQKGSKRRRRIVSAVLDDGALANVVLV